ncbi:MAG: hypothetical protein A2Z28_08120 [Chloroflexi bacterium RBG_16_51_9]|nr:MAG: hypothetical protein A2Z28_08120 [Chloroflexi bacterium RBG_16_51_9]
MSPRVYVLLDIIAGKSGRVTQTLRSKPGVILADEMEDQSRIIMVVEADDRQKLAELTIQALSSVDSVTDGLQLLPAKNEGSANPSLECVHPGTRRSKRSRE